MLKRIYLSPLGVIISLFLGLLSLIHRPFMVYGYYNYPTKKYLKRTRTGSTVKFVHKKGINLSDNIWIGHYALIDGIGGVNIGQGVHLSSHSVIYSHSSQDAIRLLGNAYLKKETKERLGYKLKPVNIGEYTFIGTGTIILPGSTIGKGCIIGAGSVVNGNVSDFSIANGNPLRIIGDTRERDQIKFGDIIDPTTYYDPQVLESKI